MKIILIKIIKLKKKNIINDEAIKLENNISTCINTENSEKNSTKNENNDINKKPLFDDDNQKNNDKIHFYKSESNEEMEAASPAVVLKNPLNEKPIENNFNKNEITEKKNNGNIKQEFKSNNSEASTHINTEDLEKNSIKNENNLIKQKNKDDFDFESNAKLFFNNCKIKLSVRKNGGKNKIKIDNITSDKGSVVKPIKFKEYLTKSSKIKNPNGKFEENSQKFAEFINEFKKNITEEYKNNFKLNLEIKLIKTDKKNSDSIYNIKALYTFIEPLHDQKMLYQEDNVLVYKTESNLQGFNFMMMDINQEKYKSIE